MADEETNEVDPFTASMEVAKEKIDEVLANKPNSLIRNKQLGDELDFSAAKDDFKNIHSLYSELKECDLTKLLIDDFNQIVGRANQVTKAYERVRQFSPSNLFPEWGNDPVLQRDRLIEEVKSAYKQSHEHFRKIIPYARRQTSTKELTNLIKETKDATSKIDQEYKKAQGITSDAAQTLQAIKETAGEAAVASYAKFFSDQADSHRKACNGWLFVIFVFLVLIILESSVQTSYLQAVVESLKGEGSDDAITIVISKLVTLSALYFGLIWASKMYRANSHNRVVNKHRENALHTFEAFIKAAEDDQQTKNAVLLQATQSIFSHQQTGYISGDSDSSAPATQILEIFKQVNQK